MAGGWHFYFAAGDQLSRGALMSAILVLTLLPALLALADRWVIRNKKK